MSTGFILWCAVLFAESLMVTHAQQYGYNGEDTLGLEYDVSMSNLGSFINKQVEDQVRTITSRINQQVLGINKDIQRQMQELGARLQTKMSGISNRMESQIHSLGKEIEGQVRESLQPVNAMLIKSAMAQGIGGTTIATYGDKIEVLIISTKKYICPGDIIKPPTSSAVKCSVKLDPLPPNDDDVCTDSSYSRVNNIYCFGSYATFSCIGDACQCSGGKMYTLDTVRSICGDTYGSEEYVQFDYYPNPTDTNLIPVPHPNPHVQCENKDAGHCVWHSNGFIVNIKDY